MYVFEDGKDKKWTEINNAVKASECIISNGNWVRTGLTNGLWWHYTWFFLPQNSGENDHLKGKTYFISCLMFLYFWLHNVIVLLKGKFNGYIKERHLQDIKCSTFFPLLCTDAPGNDTQSRPVISLLSFSQFNRWWQKGSLMG